jgi:hypothetical protein
MSGAVNCWGVGQPSPLQVPQWTSGVTSVSAGYSSICAVQSGAAKCFGENENGQLGDGTVTDANSPIQVSGLTANVTAIAAGTDHGCAIKSAALYCWGNSYMGQLGDGSVGFSPAPLSVPNFYPLGTQPPDTTNPVISNISPANGASTTSVSVALTYTATDNSGAAPTCTPASGSTVALNLGSNAILISCHDAANNTATATVNVTRTTPPPIPDTTPPVISNVVPAGGTTTTGSSIVLTYSASDNSGAAPTCTPASGSTVALILGANAIVVSCHDADNNQATASISVTRKAAEVVPPPQGSTPGTGTTITGPTKTLLSGKPKLASNRRSATSAYVCAKTSCVITLKITIAKKRYSVKSKSLSLSASDTPDKATIAINSTLRKKLLAAKKKHQKVTVKAAIA